LLRISADGCRVDEVGTFGMGPGAGKWRDYVI